MREHDLKPYIYRTDDYGATWTLLTDGKNGIPDDFPTRVDPRGSQAARPALRRHGVRVLRLVQRRQELAAAAAEPAGDADHRHQGSPQRPRHLDHGPVGVDHGQRHAAAAAGGDGTRPAAAHGAQASRRRTLRARALGGPAALLAASSRPAAATRTAPPRQSDAGAVPRHARRFAIATAPRRRRPTHPEYPAPARRSTSTSRTRQAPTPRWRSPTRAARCCAP